MRPPSRSFLAMLLLLLGLAALAWSWWPIPHRQGTARLTPPSLGGPVLDVQWDVPTRLRRGGEATLLLRLSLPASEETASPATSPIRLRLTLERVGSIITPDAPFEIALMPGESVSARWTVTARDDASARWLVEWVTESGSQPAWLHEESWPVQSLFGLPAPVARALGLLLVAVGLLQIWLAARRAR
jgi:hypothetical protein